MTMPRYVVNMEEGLPFLLPQGEGEGDENINFERGYQRTKGLILELNKGEKTVSWKVDKPIFITGIAFMTNLGNSDTPFNLREDTLNFYIDDKLIIENKPMREHIDYMNSRVFLPVHPFSELVFSYDVQKGSDARYCWIEIDYIADPVLQKVVFIGKTDEYEIYRETALLSEGHYILAPRTIEGYYPLKNRFEFNTRPIFNSPTNNVEQEVEIRYEKYPETEEDDEEEEES